METVAVYWESRIKTYGFQDASELSLLELGFQTGRLPEWGLEIQEMGDSGISFELVLIQYGGEKELKAYLLFKRKWEEKVIKHTRQVIRKDDGETFHITSPVELISFFGPHFGDRYGIADSAFRALRQKDITIIAAGCSGSAVYLVLPDGMAREAKAALAKTFEAP